MPQMSPTMWTIILVLTLFMVWVVSTWLYYLSEKKANKKTNKNKKTIIMKW
uniref:ATP synthase F0 subunit 8 n=1 Tax=Mesohomotoma hibisci TaxID=399243 RepID=A0A344A2J9_9HEMI|nr:ATP synthase F0 subunit 8 [Mesohomotoma hibisci]